MCACILALSIEWCIYRATSRVAWVPVGRGFWCWMRTVPLLLLTWSSLRRPWINSPKTTYVHICVFVYCSLIPRSFEPWPSWIRCTPDNVLVFCDQYGTICRHKIVLYAFLILAECPSCSGRLQSSFARRSSSQRMCIERIHFAATEGPHSQAFPASSFWSQMRKACEQG